MHNHCVKNYNKIPIFFNWRLKSFKKSVVFGKLASLGLNSG